MHGSLDAYWTAKSQIARHQYAGDTIFYPAPSDECRRIAELSPGHRIPFAAADAPVQIDETHLLGAHNLANIAAAWRVTQHLGVDRETAALAIRAFEGLPHRLQVVGTHHGIQWVDDAISTTPESTIARARRTR